MIEWARINYRSDTGETKLNMVCNGKTIDEPISEDVLLVLEMSILERRRKLISSQSINHTTPAAARASAI